MARRYTTIGRRMLAVLAEGGPRKKHILEAMAARYGHGKRAFERHIARLVEAGLIVVTNHRRGGCIVALAPVSRHRRLLEQAARHRFT